MAITKSGFTFQLLLLLSLQFLFLLCPLPRGQSCHISYSFIYFFVIINKNCLVTKTLSYYFLVLRHQGNIPIPNPTIKIFVSSLVLLFPLSPFANACEISSFKSSSVLFSFGQSNVI